MAESFFVGQTVYWGDWQREEGLDSLRAVRAVATASSLCNSTIKTEPLQRRKSCSYVPLKPQTCLHTCLHNDLNGEKTRRNLLIMHGTNYS